MTIVQSRIEPWEDHDRPSSANVGVLAQVLKVGISFCPAYRRFPDKGNIEAPTDFSVSYLNTVNWLLRGWLVHIVWDCRITWGSQFPSRTDPQSEGARIELKQLA